MGALVRVNAAIERGRVRSERGSGCKLYLAELQALPCRVVSSTLSGCKVIMKYFDTFIYNH